MGFPYQYTEDWERAAFKTPTPMGIMIPTPRTAAEVFNDFKGRRAGFIKALTVDFERFHQQCDPEKEHLCLFAFPNETWQVKPPTEMVPPELPEPVLGINFSRDLIQEKDWLTNISLHSDSWLLSVAFHMATDYGFDKSESDFCQKHRFPMYAPILMQQEFLKPYQIEKPCYPNIFQEHGRLLTIFGSKFQPWLKFGFHRERLFKMINDLPTIVEVVSGNAKEEVDEEGATLCGACGAYYGIDGFWIYCDLCNKWFHGTCVKITAAEAEYIEHYKCPTCSNEGAKV